MICYTNKINQFHVTNHQSYPSNRRPRLFIILIHNFFLLMEEVLPVTSEEKSLLASSRKIFTKSKLYNRIMNANYIFNNPF